MLRKQQLLELPILIPNVRGLGARAEVLEIDNEKVLHIDVVDHGDVIIRYFADYGKSRWIVYGHKAKWNQMGFSSAIDYELSRGDYCYDCYGRAYSVTSTPAFDETAAVVEEYFDKVVFYWVTSTERKLTAWETECRSMKREQYIVNRHTKIAEIMDRVPQIPEEDLQMVSPEMKRADIREIKAFERQAPQEEPAEQESDAPQWIVEFIKQNGLEKLAHTSAFENRNIAQLIEEVNPTGTKTFRHKRTMVSMFADKIMVKEFPNAPERMEWEEFFEHAIPLIRSMGEAKESEAEPEVPEMAQEVPKPEPEMPKVEQKMPEPEKKAQEEPRQQAEPTIAPAQKEPPSIEENNEKTDSAIAEEPAAEPTEEPEQVEIDEILPAPEEPDPMRDLKDRFTAELNSLRVMLDCENFSGMAQSIERLEHLRIKMAGMAALR